MTDTTFSGTKNLDIDTAKERIRSRREVVELEIAAATGDRAAQQTLAAMREAQTTDSNQ